MEKETKKTPRASQTRSKTERPKVWTPPSALDAPEPPKGFKHRWLRAESQGFDDVKNIQGRLRSGYELVRADEYPNDQFPSYTEGKYAGIIGHGGLVLSRVPEEIVDSRNEYFAQQAKERNEALERDLRREQHKSMPISQDRQSRVTFGGTKKS